MVVEAPWTQQQATPTSSDSMRSQERCFLVEALGIFPFAEYSAPMPPTACNEAIPFAEGWQEQCNLRECDTPGPRGGATASVLLLFGAPGTRPSREAPHTRSRSTWLTEDIICTCDSGSMATVGHSRSAPLDQNRCDHAHARLILLMAARLLSRRFHEGSAMVGEAPRPAPFSGTRPTIWWSQ